MNVSALLNSSVTSSSGTKVSARFEAMDLSSADRHGKCPWSPAYAVMALFLLNHLHQRVVQSSPHLYCLYDRMLWDTQLLLNFRQELLSCNRVIEVCNNFLEICQNVHHHSLGTEAIIYSQVQYVSTAAQVWHLNKAHVFHHICPTVPEHEHDLLLINFPFLKYEQKCLSNVLSCVGL